MGMSVVIHIVSQSNKLCKWVGSSQVISAGSHFFDSTTIQHILSVWVFGDTDSTVSPVSLVSNVQDLKWQRIKTGEPVWSKNLKKRGEHIMLLHCVIHLVSSIKLFEWNRLNQSSRDFVLHFQRWNTGIENSLTKQWVPPYAMSPPPFLLFFSPYFPPLAHMYKKCTHACMLAHPCSPRLITSNEKSSPLGHRFHPVSDEQKLHV